jgi:hypothetical protein
MAVVQKYVGAIALALGLAPAMNAMGATVNMPAISAISLGKFVADSTASTFSVAASSGTVTKISGSAIRLTSGVVTVPTVTINCTATCKKTFTVQITTGSTTGGRSTTITSFNVAHLSGTAGQITFSPTSPPPAAPLTFTFISNSNNPCSVTFSVGLTSTFNASTITGNTTWTYTVAVS